MARDDKRVILEGVQIIFRNFSGKEGKYNREGDRNFAALLDPHDAKNLEREGWNVKWLNPREEGDPPQAYLPITVKYGRGRPPRVVMVTDRGRTPLGEDELEILDWTNILSCDLIFRPYEWVVNGKSGIKAYLQSLFVHIDEDPLERKYADLDRTNDG